MQRERKELKTKSQHPFGRHPFFFFHKRRQLNKKNFVFFGVLVSHDVCEKYILYQNNFCTHIEKMSQTFFSILLYFLVCWKSEKEERKKRAII
jgi:hypothetical protein